MQENTVEHAASPSTQNVNLREFPTKDISGPSLLAGNLEIISGVKVKIEVSVGSAEMTVSELFSLSSGSVVGLDQLRDAPLAVRLDGRTIALGTLVVVGDNFGIRISDVLPVADPENSR